MEAGRLRQRVTLQRRTETSDGHDGFTETWADVEPTRRAAEVLALGGSDLERARQVDPRASHQVAVRWWPRYPADLAGGRARVIWHDGVIGDRTLELVEPPREVVPREELAMVAKEPA